MVNTAVANLIREGKTFQIPSLMQTQRQLGMRTLNDSLLELVKAKTIDAYEIMGRKRGLYVLSYFKLDPLRHDPRYHEMLKKIGLEQ